MSLSLADPSQVQKWANVVIVPRSMHANRALRDGGGSSFSVKYFGSSVYHKPLMPLTIRQQWRRISCAHDIR
jgi:hypothetical protein